MDNAELNGKDEEQGSQRKGEKGEKVKKKTSSLSVLLSLARKIKDPSMLRKRGNEEKRKGKEKSIATSSDLTVFLAAS